MIADIAFPVPLRRTFYYRLSDLLLGAARPGLRVLAPFGPRTATGLIIKLHEDSEVDLSGFKTIKTIDTLLDREPVFRDDIPQLALWMQARWNAPVGLAFDSFFPRGLPDLSAAPAAAAPGGPFLPDQPAPLSGKLAAAAEKLSAFVRAVPPAGGPAAHILFGPPQHGRYEIYLELIKKAVSGGGQALCLVPDLNLLPHFTERLGTIFKPEAVAVWHSRITPKQKRIAWLGARDGSVKVVLGARSASFLPFRDLALAIIDEEQDDIYKQEEQEPNFHARELLLKRARYHNACVVLASACPSMEAYSGVVAGRFTWNELPRPGRARPAVTVVDMEKYPWDIISPPLAEKLKKTVADKKQALVIAGRKGFATLFMCANCGWTKRCARCRVPMGTTKKEGEESSFVCWRCGRKEPVPVTCPTCTGKVFREKGTGTQKAESCLKKSLPEAKVARFDGDLLKGSVKNAAAVYGAFMKGETDILVGTRLLARGHDFPNLGAIGVIDSDAGLSTADFRASEKVFQTLFEACSTLETASAGTEFIVQTRQPGHYIFSVLPALDYLKFAADELATRKDFFYPPFSQLVRLGFASFDQKALSDFSGEVFKVLDFPSSGDDLSAQPEILGPMAVSDLKKSKLLKEYYLVKLPDEASLAWCLERLRDLKPPKSVKFKATADPYGLG